MVPWWLCSSLVYMLHSEEMPVRDKSELGLQTRRLLGKASVTGVVTCMDRQAHNTK